MPEAFESEAQGTRGHARFVEQDALGRGGGGRVVRGHDQQLSRDVALKIVSADRPQALARLRREAAILVALEHPGIVPLYDMVERADGGLQLALRIVRGSSLERVLALAKPSDKAALPGRLRHLSRAAEAVAWAHHRGFVHRDLKPANIMIGDFGETQVIDWGLATRLDESAAASARGTSDVPAGAPADAASSDEFPHLTQAGAVLGTPRYMSPEQARGERVDARADVWALGAILFEIVAGRPAFAATAVSEVLAAVRAGRVPDLRAVPGVAPELIAIVNKAMGERSARYPDARAFADDLNAWLDGRPVAAHRYRFRQRVVRFVKRRRLSIAVGAGLLATALAVALASSQLSPTLPAENAALRDALSQGRGELAQILALEAEKLCLDGAVPEAVDTARRALELAPSPIATGVLVQVGEQPRLTTSIVLPPLRCVAKLLHPDGHTWLCRESDVVTLWQGEVQRWRVGGQFVGAAFVDGGARVALLSTRNTVTHVDVASGAVLGTSDSCGTAMGGGAGAHQSALAFTASSGCFGLVDGQQGAAHLARIQALARLVPRVLTMATSDDGFTLLSGDGELVHGGIEVLSPLVAPELVHRRVALDATTVLDVLAMMRTNDAIILTTLRGEVLRLDHDGHVLARRVVAPNVPLIALARSPSGHTLSVLLERGGPAVLDAVSLQELARLPAHAAGEAAAMLLVDDTTVVTLGDHLDTWRLGPARVAALRGLDALASFAVDAAHVVVAHDRSVSVLEPASGRVIATRTTPGLTKTVALSASGDELAVSWIERGVWRLTLPTLSPLPSEQGEMMRRLGYSASGSLFGVLFGSFLSAESDHEQSNLFELKEDVPIDLAIVGDRGALVGRNGTVSLVQIGPPPLELTRCLVPGAVAIGYDGALFAVATIDEVRVIDPIDCAVHQWLPATGRLTDVDVRGPWIAAAARSGHVHVWDRSGRLLASSRAHAQRASQVSLDPDAGVLWSAGWDGVLRRHDLRQLR